jgi:hypothetical protein
MRVLYGYNMLTDELYIYCDDISYPIYSLSFAPSTALKDTYYDTVGNNIIGSPDAAKVSIIAVFLELGDLAFKDVYLTDSNVTAFIDIDGQGTYTITGTQYIVNNSMIITIKNPPSGTHEYDVFLLIQTSIFGDYVWEYNTSMYSDFAYTLYKNAYKFGSTKTFTFINTNSTAQEILLPPITTVADGTVVVIKDKLGSAGSGPITIYPGAVDDPNFSVSSANANNRYSYFDTQYRFRDSTIDGQGTYTINTNRGAVVLIKTNNNWYILSKYTGNASIATYNVDTTNKSTSPTVNVLQYNASTNLRFTLPHPPSFIQSNPHPFIYIIAKHSSSVQYAVNISRVSLLGSVIISAKIDNYTNPQVTMTIPSANDPACLILFTDGTDWYIVGYQTATFTAQTYNSTAASSTLTRTDNPKSMVFVNASNTKLINLPTAIPETDKSSLYFVKLLGNIGSGVVQIQSGTTSGIAGRLQFNGRADAFRITGNYGYAWIVGSANTGATLKGYWIVASG